MSTKDNKSATHSALDFFSRQETPITVSYTQMGGPAMTFFLRPFMLKAEHDARQAHFALDDNEKEEATPAHNLEMLASLSTRAPEGVPDFPVNFAGGGVADAMRVFFGDGNPMKVKVVADVMTRYYRVTQPAEFFRGV